MNPVLLFDGPCVLCNRLLHILKKLDRSGMLHYESLQSEAAEQLGHRYGFDPKNQQSLVLIVNDAPLFGHQAVRALPELLGLPAWHGYRLLIGMYSFLPEAWQGALYRFVARNRYRWFGRTDVCELPGR